MSCGATKAIAFLSQLQEFKAYFLFIKHYNLSHYMFHFVTLTHTSSEDLYLFFHSLSIFVSKRDRMTSLN